MNDIILNIVGGIIVAVLTSFAIWLWRLFENYRIKKLFGNDFKEDGLYSIAYPEFTLKNSVSKGETRPYKKPDSEDAGAGFSIENPISGCEVRSIGYLATMFGKHRVSAPHITPDTKIKNELDLSFIALGGPLSNSKTSEAQENSSNSLIKMKQEKRSFFVTADDDELRMDYQKGYDYGLILRIRPSQFPERVWIVCAGIGEWGTSGASYYLCRRWMELLKKKQKWHNLFGLRKDTDFAAIIKVEPGKDESAELVKFYREK
jgi:hypothetical protein